MGQIKFSDFIVNSTLSNSPDFIAGVKSGKTIKSNNPSTYKSYVVQLTQSGANAPVPVVLEDTIGIIDITYINVGIYTINPINTGSFPAGKTFINGNIAITGATNYIGKVEFKNEIDDIQILTYEKGNTPSDDVLTGYMSGDQIYYLEI